MEKAIEFRLNEENARHLERFRRGSYRRTSFNRPSRVLKLRRSMSCMPKFGRLRAIPQIKRSNRYSRFQSSPNDPHSR